jgi:hypothetical protein
MRAISPVRLQQYPSSSLTGSVAEERYLQQRIRNYKIQKKERKIKVAKSNKYRK